jgi:hypothetical protein
MRINVWVSAKILIHRYHGSCPFPFSRLDEKNAAKAKSVDNSGLGRLVLCACKIGCVSEATARTDGRGS